MNMNKEEKEIKEEIRKEFQLDRMILFSDAVFAIVITLMAIEIRLPFSEEVITPEMLSTQLLHLIPTILAYTASFAFIGLTWYQHLQVFGLLKDYDKGLVLRNLILLFCMGFFPFSVTLIAHQNTSPFLPAGIYFAIIVACKSAQLVLQHYILVKRPELRISKSTHQEMVRFRRSRIALVLMVITAALVTISMMLITDRQIRNVAWWWFFLFPFVLKYFQKKIK